MTNEEDNLEVSPNLKKLLLSEVDLIRDALSILEVFTEGTVKTTLNFIEDIEQDKPHDNEWISRYPANPGQHFLKTDRAIQHIYL